MISYKFIFQIVSFLSNLLRGNLQPHLVNEIDDEFVKKYIKTETFKRNNDLTTLKKYLNNLYGKKRNTYN